jgi:hypothetical protein
MIQLLGVSSDDEVDEITNQPNPKAKSKKDSPTFKGNHFYVETCSSRPCHQAQSHTGKPDEIVETHHDQLNFCARKNVKLGSLKPSTAVDLP